MASVAANYVDMNIHIQHTSGKNTILTITPDPSSWHYKINVCSTDIYIPGEDLLRYLETFFESISFDTDSPQRVLFQVPGFAHTNVPFIRIREYLFTLYYMIECIEQNWPEHEEYIKNTRICKE